MPVVVAIPDTGLRSSHCGDTSEQRDVLLGVAAFAVLARPIGVGEHEDAALDDATDHRDMAERQARLFGESDDCADAGGVATLVRVLGLVPAGPGVAIDLDTRSRAREAEALTDIIEEEEAFATPVPPIRPSARAHKRTATLIFPTLTPLPVAGIGQDVDGAFARMANAPLTLFFAAAGAVDQRDHHERDDHQQVPRAEFVGLTNSQPWR